MAKTDAPRKLTAMPPVEHPSLSGAKLLNALRQAGNWKVKEIEIEGVSFEGVKRWLGDAIPEANKYPALTAFLCANASSPDIADAWHLALTSAWDRDRRADSEKRRQAAQGRSQDLTFIKALQTRILDDRRINHLPALFETDRTVPLANAYVDLRIVPVRQLVPMPQLLEQRLTLAERIRKRTEHRLAMRRSPQDALDHAGVRCRLILGAPGSGKSSLLRRLALDIAGGTWKTAAVPLFVEARVFAQALRAAPGLSLIDYVCRQAAAHAADAAKVRDLLTAPDVEPARRGILLVDGLDEIASDRAAVAAVYGALADSSNGMAWIATARPAGLMQALNEQQRYEMSDLDAEAVSALIDNWCHSNSTAQHTLDPAALKAELRRLPSNRELETNPFLLTALCYLKSTAPGEPLPNSRIAVYEALLERIAHQAQARHNDRAILSDAALRDLTGFACYLYQQPNGAMQVFRMSSWRDYTAQSPRPIATDFIDHVLPSRLLTIWHEADPQYHFLHLTLQEHLIAQAMLDWDVTEALRYRFYPAWRAVFRFYGALLWQRRRHAQFAVLTTALFETRDINDLSLITLAEIFADAGLRDTTRQLGVDLRGVILASIEKTSDHIIGREAFIDVLALLDPDWLTARTIEQADHLISICAQSVELAGQGEHYRGHGLSLEGRDLGSPYLRLARARTRNALTAIEQAFWGDDDVRALLAAAAYADIATPAQRDRVVRAADAATIPSDMARRLYAFVLVSRHAGFLPFLGRLTRQLAVDGDDPFSEALSLIADIGGDDARVLLEERLLFELRRHKSQKHQIETCTRATARLGGQHAIAVLAVAERTTRAQRWQKYIRVTRLSITPGGDAELIEYCADPVTCTVVMRALADAAFLGRLPSPRMIIAVKQQAAEEAMYDAFDLAVLEQQMLAAGAPPQLCGPLLVMADSLLDNLNVAEPGSIVEQGIVGELSLILEATSLGRWTPARELIEAILRDPKKPDELLEAAIAAAGLVFEHSRDADMLHRLERILYDEAYDVEAYDVTLAIGRIDLERLFQLRGALTGASTLQQIAAETDCIVFEDRFVDRDGNTTTWTDPPRKVLYTVAKSRQKIADLVAHELSRFNLIMTPDWPADCCVAAVTIEPLGDSGRTIDATELMMIEAEGGKGFRMCADWPLERVQEFAREMGASISGAQTQPLRAKRRPPVKTATKRPRRK